jgi:hypothetical protein
LRNDGFKVGIGEERGSDKIEAFLMGNDRRDALSMRKEYFHKREIDITSKVSQRFLKFDKV